MLKSKTILTISVLAAAISLTACQPKDKEPQTPATQTTAASEAETALKLVGDTEKLQFELPECDGNACPELNIDRLQSNQAFIDDFIDQQIVKDLSQIIDISPMHSSSDTTASSAVAASSEPAVVGQVITPKLKLEKQVQPYLAAFLGLDQELKALSSNHQISLMIKPKILNAKDPLATVVLNTSSYLGGAHGSSSQHYYNFDLKQQKLVSLDDLLLPNQKAALNRVAHEAFRTWVVYSKLATNVDEYEQAWKFSLSNNYYLGTEGLILQYGEYEIGPYVVGLPRLTIGYDQLQKILKPEYLPKAKQSAQAASEAKS